MTDKVVIHWFRQDLRLADNPALSEAIASGKVLPIYILDNINSEEHYLGGASRIWLHHSLVALNKSLSGNLQCFVGNPIDVLLELAKKHSISDVFWNRCYEPWRIKRDKNIKEELAKSNINVTSHNSALLWEPWHITKDNGDPYKVFTPFYRKGCLGAKPPREPIFRPEKIDIFATSNENSVGSLNLIPNKKWAESIIKGWDISELGAEKQLEDFVEIGMRNYKDGRNFPAKPYISRLSPYLHFGQISPNQIWYSILDEIQDSNTDHFLSELGWREFSYSLLYYNPKLPSVNLQAKFDNFPWQKNIDNLKAWQQGMTGIPMVDAGMRELYQTGFMHNRVRMIVGSFLVKNLLIDWREGEKWFWDCLFDADLASNSASWQWIAGCGADAAPYFRIFNCITQGEKFDPDGDYIRRYIPEISKLPNKFIFNPSAAPELVLQEAGVVLGKSYPKPIVDLKKSRNDALAAFASLKQE